MKRAKPQVVYSPLFKRNKLLNHINYLSSIENPFYGGSVYHGSKIGTNSQFSVQLCASLYNSVTVLYFFNYTEDHRGGTECHRDDVLTQTLPEILYCLCQSHLSINLWSPVQYLFSECNIWFPLFWIILWEREIDNF